MEYLDTYDETGLFIGRQERNYVHENALWHNTVHCWLYDKKGNIYFQIRADEKTFYTTASGHVNASETIKEAFGREIKEEIGIDVDYTKAVLVDVVTFKMDKVKKDGSLFRDRAFANVYALEFLDDIDKFTFDLTEVDGLVQVNAIKTLELFKNGNGKISAAKIMKENDKNKIIYVTVGIDEFLVNPLETAIEKYGDVLNKVIELQGL